MFKINYTKASFLSVVFSLWQFLQVFIALFLMLFLHKSVEKYTNEHTGMTVWRVGHSFRSCWSLGPFVFLPDKQPEDIYRHETGHSVQSLILGPMFLFFVGLPSVVLFIIRRTRGKDQEWYYSHYPENWANKLGGVGQKEEQKGVESQKENV